MAIDRLLLRQFLGVFNFGGFWHVPEPSAKRCKSLVSAENAHLRLVMRSTMLSITYGKKATPIVNSSRYFVFADNGYNERGDAWRLFYLDRSQLKGCPWKGRARRHKKRSGIAGTKDATAADLRNNENERRAWCSYQGPIAGLFISMAQARQRDIEDRRNARARAHRRANPRLPLPGSPTIEPSKTQPQLQPRYQLLLTDNEKDRSCIHLFTAQVSDLLLAHFATPAHLPPAPLSNNRGSHLLKIHHTMIPFHSYTSFPFRLRTTIIEHANGSADGFFGD